MPFYEGDAIGKTIEKIKRLPILNKTFKNPLFTAIIITLIIMLIIYLTFLNYDEEDDSLIKKTVKVGVYSFIATAMFVFINNFFLEEKIDEQQKEGAFDDIFNDINMGETNEKHIPI